jgi:membrane protein DedA with SNARE-associated domain
LSETFIPLVSYSEPFIYAGLLLILFACGLGLPVPEEITLLGGGFLAQLGLIRIYPTIAILFIGVLSGDMVLFSIGRKWGHGIITHRHIRKVFTERRLERVRQFFRDHGNKTIFIARFISGFRVAAFLAAGTMGMKPAKFFFLDFLAALIMIPLIMGLGYFFSSQMEWLTSLFTQIDFLLKILAVLLGLAAFGYYLWWKYSKKESSNQ